MRKLDITPITDDQRFPIKKGTLQFLQDSYTEVLIGIVRSLVGPTYNPGICYCLYGLQNVTAAPVYNITDGLVLFQNELFFIPVASFSALGSNTAILQLSITQYTTDADPVTFTDDIQFNVHNIRQLQIVQGVSGSGLVDYSSVKFMNLVIPPQLNAVESGILTITGTYPDLTFDVPANSNLHPCSGAGSVHVGDVPGGGVSIAVVFGSAGQAPAQTAPYYIMFTQISQGGSAATDTTVTITVIQSSIGNAGFSFRCQEWASGVQSLQVDYMLFLK